MDALVWRRLWAQRAVTEEFRAGVRQRIWFHHNYRRIHNLLHNTLLAWGMKLHPTDGLEPLAAPEDPFRKPYLYRKPKADGEFPVRQFSEFAAAGLFDPGRYSHRGTQIEAEAFVRILQRCRRLSLNTRVILLPESASFRDLVPIMATNRLVESAGSIPGVELLDGRDLIPPEGFYEHLHLNEYGRTRLTRKLGEDLQ